MALRFTRKLDNLPLRGVPRSRRWSTGRVRTVAPGAQPEVATACAEALGISVHASIVENRGFLGALNWTELKVPRPELRLTLPEGWRAVEIRDDLPVVGRVEDFEGRGYPEWIRFEDFDAYIADANTAMDRRQYGTAAWILRHLPPFDWYKKKYDSVEEMQADLDKQWPVYNATLVDCYTRWNRPRIAERLQREPMY